MKNIIFLFLFLFLFLPVSSTLYAQKNALSEAIEKMNKNDIEGALSFLNSFIEKNPNSSQAYSMRSTVRSVKGDLQGTIDDLSKAIEISPSNSEFYSRRAQFKLILNDIKGALQDYDSAIEKGAEGDRIFTSRAMLKLITNDKAGALKDFEIAVKIRPHSIPANMGYAQALRATGQSEKAINVLESLLNKIEQDWNGDFPLPKFKSVGEKATIPQQPEITNKNSVVLQNQRVTSTYKAKTLQEAENQMAQMEPFLNLPNAYSILASLYEEKNDLAKASENIDKAFALKTGGDIPFYDVRARIRFKQGNYEGSVSDWNNALKIMPPFAGLYLERGLAFHMSGREKEAKADFDKFLQMNPKGQQLLDKKLNELKNKSLTN